MPSTKTPDRDLTASGVKKTTSGQIPSFRSRRNTHLFSNKCPQIPASRVASVSSTNALEKRKVTIWPEWNDADVNAEKWESSQKGKEDKKGKSPTAAAYFEDPDGKLELPASLRVSEWKRPQDFISSERGIVVVDTERMANDFDLISKNEHLHESELLRYFISQVTTLWGLCVNKDKSEVSQDTGQAEDNSHTWRPWEHIYSLCKVNKHHVPLYNPHGKYAVRLYWMGCWRKILVDDLMPFDDNDQLLLPTSTLSYELWPMLLAKAIIKIASLDYSGGNPGLEFGDMFVIHCLTGWLPEAIPLQHGYLNEVWELLKTLLPDWQLPEPETEKDTTEVLPTESVMEDINIGHEISREKLDSRLSSVKDIPGHTKDNSKEAKQEGKEKGKEGIEKGKEGTEKNKEGVEKLKEQSKEKLNKEKGGQAEKGGKEERKEKKDKQTDKKEKQVSEEAVTVPEKPEVVVFAMFGQPAKYPIKISVLGEMANASERLRQNGLSHLYPHPVCITQTRSCPLEPPTPPEVIPAWKLIRPRKKKEAPTDEPKVEPEPPKKIQCLEISSPFVNYRVGPMPIPTYTCRKIFCLERGSTHTPHGSPIEETDELADAVVKPASAEPEPHTVVHELDEVNEGGQDTQKDTRPSTGRSHRSSARSERAFDIGTLPTPMKSRSGLQRRDTPIKSGKDSRSHRREEGEDKKERGKTKGTSKMHLEALVHECASQPENQEGELAHAPDSNREDHHTETSHQKKRWMDFDEFCICFRMVCQHIGMTFALNYISRALHMRVILIDALKTLYIFHKPNTYLCNQRYSDFKNVVVSASAPTPTVKGEKKQASSTPAGSGVEDKSSHYLFVDNLQPTEIIVAVSVVPRWFETTPLPTIEEKKPNKTKEKDTDMNHLANSASPADGPAREQTTPSPPPVTPGTLLAEPFSWKSLVTGQPILRLRTSGTRAAVLNLPPGRHVLKFIMSSPLAHHVHMCSTVNFVFGDEDTIMPYLVNESCQFKESAMQVLTSVGKCISCFTEEQPLAEAQQQLVALHCPFLNNKLIPKRKHFQLFNDALYNMLRKAARELVSPELALAWRAFSFDVMTPNILGQILSPQTGSSTSLSAIPEKSTPTISARGTAKAGNKNKVPSDTGDKSADISRISRYSDPSPQELVAATKIQKVWKGYWTRKVKQAHTPGTKENAKAQEHLQKSWTVVEENAEENSLILFREMLRREQEVIQYYPFHNDEWNKICYADYRGSYPDQPANTWFVIFREIFFVREETLMVPRLYVSVPTCLLRVIDNDTGRQLPSVFQKVAPYFYKQNKKGYTFVAEARSVSLPLTGAAWKMRLIGSSTLLPAPQTGEISCSFFTKEIQDYYVPDPKSILFRYSVKTTEEQLCSLQVSTSKADVYVRLCILDGEEELASATGKGHVVIPAFVFLRDPHQPVEDYSGTNFPQADAKQLRPDSSQHSVSPRAGKPKLVPQRSQSGKPLKPGKNSDLSVFSDDREKTHKYIIQATVLKNSWPLSDDDLEFVYQQKGQEKTEIKDEVKDKPLVPEKSEKNLSTILAKAIKTKAKGDKADKGDKGVKEKVDSRPHCPPIITPTVMDRPHWRLRVVVDSQLADEIELKKDTERADEIRAMKKAWEDAEPGRAAKALQSRQKYLAQNIIPIQPGEECKEGKKEGEPIPSQDSVIPVMPPDSGGQGKSFSPLISRSVPTARPHTAKGFLRPLDITPFVKRTLDKPRLLDSHELERMTKEQQMRIAEFKHMRKEVEFSRAQDKFLRNQTKIKQLDDAKAMQLELDLKREAVNVPREAFRQVYLEAERKRQEELERQEEALRAEQDAARGDKSRRKSAKDKKKKKT